MTAGHRRYFTMPDTTTSPGVAVDQGASGVPCPWAWRQPTHRTPDRTCGAEPVLALASGLGRPLALIDVRPDHREVGGGHVLVEEEGWP
jgi:hypothetical protein